MNFSVDSNQYCQDKDNNLRVVATAENNAASPPTLATTTTTTTGKDNNIQTSVFSPRDRLGCLMIAPRRKSFDSPPTLPSRILLLEDFSETNEEEEDDDDDDDDDGSIAKVCTATPQTLPSSLEDRPPMLPQRQHSERSMDIVRPRAAPSTSRSASSLLYS